MGDELDRAYQFLAKGDMRGQRTEPSRYGVAVFDDALPLRYDSNYLLVDRLPAAVAAEDLIAEAGRLGRPSIMVRDQRTGERLAPTFERLGWKVHRGLVMAHRGAGSRTADTGLVREVGQALLRPAHRRELAGEPWATPEVVEQLLDGKLAIARAVEARFLAVLVDGEVAGYADLYHDGRTAQVEDVATLPEHRGRGYASALVLRALEEARRAGCDLAFLVADAEDWPKELYRRLGFEDLGRYVKFIRPG
ncbi:MAG TPA: GNAT family N-acetyltransferase [Actinomycetota bacterium]